jgi:MATE family multidrug resistance protein
MALSGVAPVGIEMANVAEFDTAVAGESQEEADTAKLVPTEPPTTRLLDAAQLRHRLIAFLCLPPQLTWKSVAITLTCDAVPIAANMLTFFITQAVTLAFVGHRLGTNMQAAFAIGLSLFNVSGMSITIGFLSALDPLCSQAFGRDPTGKELIPIAHRGVWLGLILTLPFIALFFTARSMLVQAFGEELGGGASEFLCHMPAYFILNTLSFGVLRALQAHQATQLSFYGSLASLAVCPIANYYFTKDTIPGAVFAITCTMLVNTITVTTLAAVHPSSKLRTLPAVTVKEYVEVVFNKTELWNFCAVGFPALVACCAEWWAFEIVLLVVAMYGPVLADTFSVAMSITVMLIASPAGVSQAASARLGNALGAGEADIAAAWRRISFTACAMFVVIDGVLLMVFGSTIAAVYTTDSVVLATLVRGLPAMFLMHSADCVQSAMQGVYRGANEQSFAAKASLAGLWCIGLPLAALAAYVAPMESKFSASLTAFSCGLVAVGILLLHYSRRWDWRQKAIDAHQASEADPKASDEEIPRDISV